MCTLLAGIVFILERTEYNLCFTVFVSIHLFFAFPEVAGREGPQLPSPSPNFTILTCLYMYAVGVIIINRFPNYQGEHIP